MKQRVDLTTPKTSDPKPEYAKCPACGGPASNVRSKRTRLVLVNDEHKPVTDKRWKHRGVICFQGCGFFLAAENEARQCEFEFNVE